MSKRVYVAGLPSSATEEQVLRLFDRSGRIWRGVFKHGYAFLDFDTHDDAQNAIKAHNGQFFLGRRLVVEWGKSQPPEEHDDREPPRRSDLSTNSIPIDERSADNSDAEYGVTLTGLPSTVGHQELRALVTRHCSGAKAVVLGPDVGNAAGTAHLVFDSFSMARAAMRELNGIRLRGFRIQSWGMTPEEMENLVKWGRIKLSSSPISQSSLTRTASTSAPGSARRQCPNIRGAQVLFLQISLFPGPRPVDWDTGTWCRSENIAERLVLVRGHGLVVAHRCPAIRVHRTPDVVPDTLTIIPVTSAPHVQVFGSPIETEVATMSPGRVIVIDLVRHSYVQVGDLPVQEAMVGEVLVTWEVPHTEIVLRLGGPLALDHACSRMMDLVVIAPDLDPLHRGGGMSHLHFRLVHQVPNLPIRPTM